jgi:hypothetical protein
MQWRTRDIKSQPEFNNDSRARKRHGVVQKLAKAIARSWTESDIALDLLAVFGPESVLRDRSENVYIELDSGLS